MRLFTHRRTRREREEGSDFDRPGRPTSRGHGDPVGLGPDHRGNALLLAALLRAEPRTSSLNAGTNEDGSFLPAAQCFRKLQRKGEFQAFAPHSLFRFASGTAGAVYGNRLPAMCTSGGDSFGGLCGSCSGVSHWDVRWAEVRHLAGGDLRR